MTDRDRLIELIQNSVNGCARHWAEIIADYLLANGVIVPPCKMGDSIFRCCEERNEIWEWQIVAMIIHPEQIIYVDDSENEFSVEDIGKTVFLTKEEAEAKLKECEGK